MLASERPLPALCSNPTHSAPLPPPTHPAEDGGAAALEAHHCAARRRRGRGHEQRVDFGLLDRGLPAALADIQSLTAGRRVGFDRGGSTQVVVDDGVGAAQQLRRTHRQQVGGAGPCTHQVALAAREAARRGRRRRRCRCGAGRCAPAACRLHSPDTSPLYGWRCTDLRPAARSPQRVGRARVWSRGCRAPHRSHDCFMKCTPAAIVSGGACKASARASSQCRARPDSPTPSPGGGPAATPGPRSTLDQIPCCSRISPTE